jgi:peptidoglycan/xylan/chitin deacetylase (PgdA/CDA1 family)
LSESYSSLISQAVHYAAFSLKRPVTSFAKAALIFSIDVDVGNHELGEKNGGKNDQNVHEYLSETVVGRIEEQAIPLLLHAFNDLDVPVTFAIRGQLTEIDNSIIDLILASPVKHEVGAHGYYHRTFTTLSRVEARQELEKITEGMRKFGIRPKSFVFPKNKVAHLPLLEQGSYLCFRAYGDLLKDGMYVKKYGNLYDIHPGFFLGKSFSSVFLNSFIDIAVRYRASLHIWFHPWNFGNCLEAINMKITKVLQPFIKYAKEKQEDDLLQFETMISMARKTQSLGIW